MCANSINAVQCGTWVFICLEKWFILLIWGTFPPPPTMRWRNCDIKEMTRWLWWPDLKKKKKSKQGRRQLWKSWVFGWGFRLSLGSLLCRKLAPKRPVHPKLFFAPLPRTECITRQENAGTIRPSKENEHFLAFRNSLKYFRRRPPPRPHHTSSGLTLFHRSSRSSSPPVYHLYPPGKRLSGASSRAAVAPGRTGAAASDTKGCQAPNSAQTPRRAADSPLA